MSKSSPRTIHVYCGELCKSSECTPDELNLINFAIEDLEPNVEIGYEGFVFEPNALPNRVLDLLQISAMVFCADRMGRRGERDSISNESWARSFEFHISVLDPVFWNQERVKKSLENALCFMTGDRSFSFDFREAELGHFESKKNQQLSLFHNETDRIEDVKAYDVMLFSGGLDSLAGLLEMLSDQKQKIITVSHLANKVVMHLQKKLISKLNQDYDDRILPYGLKCHNKKALSSLEETQRTRMFLFSSIAFAICECFGKHHFYVYENGVTSLNFSVQTDVINGRASRTTHPKTLGLLRKFFKLFDPSFDIIAPYYMNTKEDIVLKFKEFGRLDLIASAVSCSSTRTKHSQCPHCGCCSQCIDRRLAMFAAGLTDYDSMYAEDFIHSIQSFETTQRLYQQMHFASAKSFQTQFDLMKNYGDETQSAIEYWPCDNPEDSLDEIHRLLMRYSDSAMRAVKQIQLKYDDPRKPITDNSFLKIISDREYLKTPFERRIDEIDKKLRSSLPLMFKTEKPKNENDFNDKVVGLFQSAEEHWFREYPIIKFGITQYRADVYHDCLIVESKYIRGSTSPSVASHGIAADITEIGQKQNALFVVYDPDRAITDDDSFCFSFMNGHPNCAVKIYR